jgi:F0F1-type ATP synthase membrane subunit b/b'
MEFLVAELQQAATTLVERARSLQAQADQERVAVLEQARKYLEQIQADARLEVERECERLRVAARSECKRLCARRSDDTRS